MARGYPLGPSVNSPTSDSATSRPPSSSSLTWASSLEVDGGDGAGAALPVRDLELAQRELAAVGGDELELVAAVRDAVVDDREHPRGAPLVAVDVAGLLVAGELERRRVEVLAVGHGQRRRDRSWRGRGRRRARSTRRRRRRRPRQGRRRRAARSAASPRAGRRRARDELAIASATRASKPAGGSATGAEREQLVGERRETLDPHPAVGAAGEVVERPGPLLAVGDPERELGGELVQALAAAHRPRHRLPSPASVSFKRRGADPRLRRAHRDLARARRSRAR